MIKEVQDYIVDLFSNCTFGQIPEDDNVLNINIYDTGKNPFFNDTTHVLGVNLYVRNKSFEEMLNQDEIVCKGLLNIYDKKIKNIHIINTKKSSGQEPQRDEKNRYSSYSSFEMTIEKIKED